MKNKKFIDVAFILLIVAAVGIISYASYAFFSGVDAKDNTFSVGETKILLEEPNWDDNDKGKNFVPGKTYLKDPTIINVKGDSYSRIILEIRDKSGTIITDEARLDKIKGLIYYDTSYNTENDPVTTNLIEGSSYSEEYISDLINNEKIYSLYNSEDYTADNTRTTPGKYVFNCSNVLNLNDKSVLFTNVVIPTDFTSDDLDLLGSFDLVLYAEAIQVTGFDTSSLAYAELDNH